MLEFLKLLADDDDEDRWDRRPPPPRRSMTDPAAWDAFWREQFESGTAAFVDMFCRSGSLIDAMRANGLKTILFAGSGISQEPRAMARIGFGVTALDLSPLATRGRQRNETLARLAGEHQRGTDAATRRQAVLCHGGSARLRHLSRTL